MSPSAAVAPELPPGGRRRALRIGLATAFLASTVAWLLARPSNDRDWVPNQSVLPHAEILGSRVTIRSVRNTRYRSAEDYTPAWEDRTYDLDRLVRVWYVVEPFSDWAGAAHTFLSFELDGPEFVSISVEVRKERGEGFSALMGLLRQYEIMYVVADERDVIGLRTNHRGDDVFVYPVRASRERVRALFVSMLERANALRERPEFYNTLLNTCTTNIVTHINTLVPGRIPWSHKVLFPGYSDRLAYDLDLLDTDLPFQEIRARYRVNEAARRLDGDPGFSEGIRRASEP